MGEILKEFEVYFSYTKRGQPENAPRMPKRTTVYAKDIEELHAKNQAWLESKHGLGNLRIDHIKEIEMPKSGFDRPPDRMVGGKPFWYKNGDPKERRLRRGELAHMEYGDFEGVEEPLDPDVSFEGKPVKASSVERDPEGRILSVELPISPEPHDHEAQKTATMPPDASGSEPASQQPQKPRRAPAAPRSKRGRRSKAADSPPASHPSQPEDPE